MKKIPYALIFVTFMLSACVVATGPGGQIGVAIAPPLPVVVELGSPGELYFYGNYYYQHRDNDWYYSRSRSGPWDSLPRDRYPREVRYKGRAGDWDKDRNQDRGHNGDDRRGHEIHKDKWGHDREDRDQD